MARGRLKALRSRSALCPDASPRARALLGRKVSVQMAEPLGAPSSVMIDESTSGCLGMRHTSAAQSCACQLCVRSSCQYFYQTTFARNPQDLKSVSDCKQMLLCVCTRAIRAMWDASQSVTRLNALVWIGNGSNMPHICQRSMAPRPVLSKSAWVTSHLPVRDNGREAIDRGNLQTSWRLNAHEGGITGAVDAEI